MRSQWIAVVAALVFLGGCDSANQNGASAPGKNGAPAAPAIAPGTTINGTVTLHDPIPVAQGAKLDVKLVDVAQLAWAPSSTATRGGSLDQSFREHLFGSPYGPTFYGGFVASSGEVPVRPAPEPDLSP